MRQRGRERKEGRIGSAWGMKKGGEGKEEKVGEERKRTEGGCCGSIISHRLVCKQDKMTNH